MNRYEIARGVPPPPETDYSLGGDYNVPEGYLKKCSLRRTGKDEELVQGFLKYLNVTKSSPGYLIEMQVRTPHHFFVDINMPLILRMTEEEYQIMPTKVKHGFEHGYVIVELSGKAEFNRLGGRSVNISRPQPSSHDEIMNQLSSRIKNPHRLLRL